MCRFTAYRGGPLAPSVTLFGGTHSLARQSWAPNELLSGSVNVDGWGVAWYQDGAPRRLTRLQPIWHDTDAENLLSSVRGTTIVSALRNATPGLPIGPDAIPPLSHGPWSFVLNGFVPSFRQRHMRTLRARLSDSLYGELLGSSDVETLFLLTIERIREGASVGEALAHVVAEVRDLVDPTGEETQLTVLVTNGPDMALVRTSNTARVNSLYRLERGGLAPEGTIISSERLTQDDAWEPVTAHSIVEWSGSIERSWKL